MAVAIAPSLSLTSLLISTSINAKIASSLSLPANPPSSFEIAEEWLWWLPPNSSGPSSVMTAPFPFTARVSPSLKAQMGSHSPPSNAPSMPNYPNSSVGRNCSHGIIIGPRSTTSPRSKGKSMQPSTKALHWRWTGSVRSNWLVWKWWKEETQCPSSWETYPMSLRIPSSYYWTRLFLTSKQWQHWMECLSCGVSREWWQERVRNRSGQCWSMPLIACLRSTSSWE